MLQAAFLHDTNDDFLGGAELSNKAIFDVAEKYGVHAVYDNLSDFKRTKQLIRESDLVIVNSTVNCDYEYLLIDYLTTCGKPYVKWEHDYNFCAKRTALCFVDRKVKGCCDSERFSNYRKLFAHAKLSVFVSPKHYEMHEAIYGAVIQHHLILPPPVDVENICSLPKKKDTVCFVGDLSWKKGGHALVDFANENPHFKIDVYGDNVIGRELPANITLKGKRPNKEILDAMAASEYFFFKPVWPEPGGRIAAEAFLSGCKTITNGNVGFHSNPYYPAYPDEARTEMLNAPALFWEKVKDAITVSEEKMRWKNTLVYKSFGGLGDFLFTLPAIHKIAMVSDKISICAPNAFHGLLKKQLQDYEIFPEDFIEKANHADYDKIIDLSNYPSYRKNESTHKIWFPSYRRLNQHAFRHYLDGVATLHPEIDNSFVRFSYFKSESNSPDKYFTVHPGAGFEAKYWPAYKYGKLIEILLNEFEDLNCQLILGPNDPKADELFEKIPERVSIPKGNLEVIGDLLAGALFHVGNDSGMTHLAGAFNTPTVTIHGPTGPGTWMSFAEHREVIWGKAGVCHIACNYDVAINCSHRICLNSVTPQRVMKHVLKLLQSILPEQENFRYIFNPEATVQQEEFEFLIQLNEKELLVEISENDENRLFENLIANKLSSGNFSESFEKLVDVLIENELLFKIPLLPERFSKNEFRKEIVDVTIVGHVKKRDSIGRQGIVIAEMLEGKFSINGIPTRDPSPEDIASALYKKITRNGTPGKLAIFTDVLQHHQKFTPYKCVPKESTVKICYSMFESSAIPEEWVSVINNRFDAVWLPDKWLTDVYKNSGVEKPLHVLPLACNLKHFLEHPIKKKANEIFTFGITAGIWMRKNIAGVIEAFRMAFPEGNEKVKLKIHSRNGFRGEIRKIENIINDDERIEFFVEGLSDSDYLKFMTSLDAYVFLSMGEGFSITPREALALGLPVILSDNTAHRTICESGLVYAVPTKFEIPGYYEAFGKAYGSFFMPDLEIAAQYMYKIFAQRDKIYNSAQARRAWASQYDVVKMKDQYIEMVREVLTHRLHENS